MKKENFVALRQTMSNEWDIISNGDVVVNDIKTRDSILLGWIKGMWSCQLHSMHNQYVHACMTNMGGYFFDVNIVYGGSNASKRRQLWNSVQYMKTILGDTD